MTAIPYIAIAKISFDYIDAKGYGFHVHEGNAYSGLWTGDEFHFVIYLHQPDTEEKYRMDVRIPETTNRFAFHQLANTCKNAHHTEEQ